jgi:multidrug efflux pump subunit AcrA (membrane-fusion protein)
MLINPFRRTPTLPARLIVLAVALILLSACGGGQGSAPAADAPPPDVEMLPSVVSATGVVVPQQYARLSMSAAGMVAQVLAAEGDQVEAGLPLLRLAGGDPQSPAPELLAAIRARELEVDAAQKALENLNELARQREQQAGQQLNSAAGQVRDLQYRLLDLELPESQQRPQPTRGL